MAETESVTSAASDLRNAYFVDTSSTSNDGRSFSSPYTAQTLDQIPTPILKMLIVLGPFIRHCAYFVQVVTWSTLDPRQSILALLLWIGCCLWTAPVLMFVLPSMILVKLARGWLKVRTSRARRERLERERQLQRLKREQEDDHHNDYYDDDEEGKKRKQQQEEEEEQLLISRKFQPEGHVSLDDTLRNLAVVNAYVDRVRQWIRWTRDELLDGSRPDVVASTLTVMLYAWPIWIVLNLVLGTNGIIALAGSLVLVSPSPWFKVTIMAIRRNALVTHAIAACWAYGVALVISMVSVAVPFRAPATPSGGRFKSWITRLMKRARREKTKALDVIKSEQQVEEQNASSGLRTEMIFQFDIYENQRWWLGMDWTTNMMPSERAPWTDNQLSPVRSKDGFELPPPSDTVQYRPIAGSGGVAIKQTTKKVWSWADGDWWVDMTGEMQGRVDRNGWEYGNNAWKQMTGHPAMQTFTRRRRWSRRARLVERRFEEPVQGNNDNASTTSTTAASSDGLRKRN
ncbi:Peroxin/Dysferlin domain-containing protein [Zychaea mexicana]|uniref:Peroxin/Dysferlin domain-containing protein n=1 Tax=Zychaea mexicana TaxID=64656 RepID=UPI0022FF37CA|nr:Peroxin/Dysferlin domain-containing protein [Zychaea mexicana]KAI9494069.1 Peroxin/Dysferlin domain-containing protein [Zychaea mexicana]